MTTPISNNGLPKLPTAPNSLGNGAPTGSSQQAAVASSQDGGSVSHGHGAPPHRSSDQVKLTDSAQVLQQASRVDNHSAVDSKRVDQVRNSLANGSYQVNPGRVADRMLDMDQQLGATGQA